MSSPLRWSWLPLLVCHSILFTGENEQVNVECRILVNMNKLAEENEVKFSRAWVYRSAAVSSETCGGPTSPNLTDISLQDRPVLCRRPWAATSHDGDHSAKLRQSLIECFRTWFAWSRMKLENWGKVSKHIKRASKLMLSTVSPGPVFHKVRPKINEKFAAQSQSI